MSILLDVPQFIKSTEDKLRALGIDLIKFKIDHIAYQSATSDEYEDRVKEARSVAELISENIVGGRRVAIMKLNEPLVKGEDEIHVMEIIEPKEGQEIGSSWEHIEYLSKMSLEEIVEEYPDLDWDISVKDREEFPMLILKLGDGLTAKFPRRGTMQEAKRIGPT